MEVKLINPRQIVRCVIGDLIKPSTIWRTRYSRTKRTPWYLRIFGIYKDKYEWTIYNEMYGPPRCDHWFYQKYYTSREEFNKLHDEYYCDENWVVSRKAFVKLFLADGIRIHKCFSDNTERDVWLSNIVGDVPLIKIDVDDE